MKKTWILFLVVGIGLSFNSCQQKASKQKPVRPNILWIVSEDNSPFIGAYGDTFATTPVLDSLAAVSVLYENAFTAAPICAPTRCTLITGMYANGLGTQHMRSNYPVPGFLKFYPRYLREAGYYCTNNSKKDYNTIDQPDAWDESSKNATYCHRRPGQPFFHIQNLDESGEPLMNDSIPWNQLRHDPTKVSIPPYYPRTPAIEHDWAQEYDMMEDLDARIGKILRQLKDDGLADSTIVFYYSDHGGSIGRSMRYLYESGLHVPLIVHFPKIYQNFAPGLPGTTTGRIVSFVDFAPTLLSLADVPIPSYMQGKAFLGSQQQPPRQYAYSFRGRMDERVDMMRSVRDKQYRYIRNYMPQRIYGQYLWYLWEAPSTRSWEREFKAGRLNEVQSRFWEPKPAEELYDVRADPHNIHNLAENRNCQEVLERMRAADEAWMKRIKDTGFIPEPMMENISKTTTLYEYVRRPDYPFDRIMETANMATVHDPKYLDELIKRLEDKNPVVRYWAVTGCIIMHDQAGRAKGKLSRLLNDPEASVRIAAAEALYDMGEKRAPLKTLDAILENGNDMAKVLALNEFDRMGEDARPALGKISKLIKPNPEKGKGYVTHLSNYIVEKLDDQGK